MITRRRIVEENNAVFHGPRIAAIHHAGSGSSPTARHISYKSSCRRGLVVDLRCGTGIYARAMTDAGYDVIGVDLSPAMIDIARSHEGDDWLLSMVSIEHDGILERRQSIFTLAGDTYERENETHVR
jgi:2-polyprenyl-3-methyl-5-hydroxy-6-metoxy-1,4-benzoquinol methylase